MNFIFINVNKKPAASSDTIPLSLGYILAYLRSLKHEGVILDDLHDRPLSLYALEMWILRLKPAVIGFSAYQINMERIRFLSRYIKSHHSDILIMLGGPQAIFMPSAALAELEDVDIICRGEGETTTAAVAECLEKNGALSSVSGITFRDAGQIVDTEPKSDLPVDLDQLPSPYLEDIINLEGKETAIMLTSRGCEYSCLFCISPRICGRRIRYHSPKRVLDEMEYLFERGVKEFWFADENFGGSPERALAILRGKMDRGIKSPFWCQTRCDLVDEDFIRKLREAGAYAVSFGLESATPDVLKNTGKGIELEHLRRMIAVAGTVGLNVELFCIFGLPGETVEKAHLTLDFVKACEIPIQGNSSGQQMQLYFGSAYEQNRDKFGFKAIHGYLPSYLSIGDRYETQTLTSTDLRKIRATWMLANENVRRDASNKERAVGVLDFLLSNEENLADEEAFYEYGTMASCALEEQQLLLKFVNGYIDRLNPNQSRLNQLISRLNVFKETHLGAGPGSRIIFDCASEVDRYSLAWIKGGYSDGVLGQGVFPDSFETSLIGVHEGTERTFECRIPEDHVGAGLQYRTVEVRLKVHKVLEPVKVESLRQLKLLNIRNHWSFPDLNRLMHENDVLYYLALKDVPEGNLAKMPAHLLMLIHYYARLHRIEDIRRITKSLAKDRKALNAVGDMLNSAGRFLEAARFYGKAVPGDRGTLIKKARSHLLGGEAQKAFEILNWMPDDGTLPFQETVLECLKVVQPYSERIPSLDRHVLDLRVKAKLGEEAANETERSAIQPIVHGDKTQSPSS